MKNKAMKVGIMPYEKYKQYTMAIACGKYKPKRNEPKIWFESIETFCQVLSTKNVELLKLIDEKKPQSIRELAEISGRQVSNLSRTLKTFNKYGIVDIIENKKAKMPVAKTTSFNIEYGKKYPSFLFDDV
jgi:predicted transcriptional regulator